MTTTQFQSIYSIEDFEAYVRSRGLVPFTLCERQNDGYYSEVRRGTPKVGHFTQVGMSVPHWLHGKTPFQRNAKYEWVRLSFKDCINKLILHA